MSQNLLVAQICRSWNEWWGGGDNAKVLEDVEGTHTLTLYNDEGEVHMVLTVQYLGAYALSADLQDCELVFLHDSEGKSTVISAHGLEVVRWVLGC